MNAVKPPVRACTSFTRSRCSSRSASVSPEPVHHRDRCLHALVVRELHDLEPAVGAGLLGRDDVAHALHEDLTAAARNRIESGLPQLADHIDCLHAEQLGEKVDLAGAESVDVNRVIALDVRSSGRGTTRTGCTGCARPESESALRRAPSARRSSRRSARRRACTLRRASDGARTRRTRNRRRRRWCS